MKRCVFCGTENDDNATECVNCHNQLPDRPDGEEHRELSEFDGLAEAEAAAGSAGVANASAAVSAGVASDTAAVAVGTEIPGAAPGTETVTAEAGAETPAEAGAVPAESAATGADAPAEAGAVPAESTAAETGISEAVASGAGSAEAQAAPGAGVPDGAQAAPGAGVPDGAQAAPDGAQYYGGQPAGDVYGAQPEGTYSGVIPPRGDAAAEGQAGADFGVGRGQTYGARQQYEARGGRSEAGQGQYGSAGYGYRQTPEAAAQGRTDLARMNTAVGSKTILFRSRKMIKGFLFFMMALTFTLMIAANFADSALPGQMDPKVSNAYYNLTNIDSSLEAILGNSNGFATQLLTELAKQIVSMVVNVNDIVQQLGTSVQLAILLIFAVPNVLYALAMWIMFGQTRRDRSKFGMGGYTLARVMMVLKFIVACLVLAIGLVISVYFVVVGASSAKFTSSFIQGLIMLIVMIVIAIFTIMYFVQWIFALKCMKVNVRGGMDIGRMPTYIGIISIIAALLSVALMIPLSPDDYIGLAAAGTRALYFLFSGIWVLVYHGVVRRAAALKG